MSPVVNFNHIKIIILCNALIIPRFIECKDILLLGKQNQEHSDWFGHESPFSFS